MAEVSTGGDGGKGKNKKNFTKIDMNPMVGLAFFIINFFILTTTFGKRQTMEVNMPDKNDKKEEAPIKASHAITIILGENDKIYWFQGEEESEPKVEVTDYSPEGIRAVLFRKNKEIGAKFVVVIKAMQ